MNEYNVFLSAVFFKLSLLLSFQKYFDQSVFGHHVERKMHVFPRLASSPPPHPTHTPESFCALKKLEIARSL